jgi:hypothetical protein
MSRLNRGWIAAHIAEAQEELRRIESQITNEGFSELESQMAMQHAFEHLNTAWNTRNVPGEHFAGASDVDFESWRKLPMDLFWPE